MGERGGEGVKGGCNREDGLGPVLPQVCIRNIQLRLSGVVRAAVAAVSNRSFIFSMIRFFGGKKLRQILVDAQRVTDSDGSAQAAAARTCAGAVATSSACLQGSSLPRLC